MRVPLRHRAAGALVLAGIALTARGAPAQAAPGAFALEDDIRFAENLGRYRFFDLAFEVLANLRTRTLDTSQAGSVAFTEARVLKRASESTADEARQLDLLTQAVDKLADWARPGTPFVYHPRRPDALEDLASLLQARGQLRAHRLAALPPDQQAETRGLADDDFSLAEEVFVGLQREYAGLADAATAAGRTDAAAKLQEKGSLTLFNRGLNALQWSEVAKVPEDRLEQAREALVDYQWELEEEKLSQYFALHYQGVVLRRLGQGDEALEVQRDVLAKAQYWWDNSLAEADPVSSGYIAELFDRTWGEIATLQADKGDVDAADATIQSMVSSHDKARLAFGRPGWQVLLAWAERLGQLGRRAPATELLKRVADGAAASAEGERARDLLASLVTTSEGGPVQASVSVLLAAAKGLFDRREFGEAASMYELAAASIVKPEEVRSFAVPAWLGASRALGSAGRHLEAGLAAEQALDAAVAGGLDAETQSALALEMYGAFDRRAKETGERFDKDLKARAIERVTKLGVGSDLPFFEARERFDEADATSPPDRALYEAAATAFRAIPPGADSSERALVYVARCLQGAGRTDEALAAYDVMLARAADPAASPKDAQGRTRREIALGEALYHKAELLLSDTVARPAEALKLLEGVESRVAGQPVFVESGKYQRAVALVALGELDRATSAVEDLQRFRPDSSYLRPAWFKLSAALQAASDKAAAAGDATASLALLARAADALWASAELGGFSSFANIVSCGDWYARAGRHDLAGRSYQKAVEAFSGPASGLTAAQLDQARLGLASALTAQRQFAAAQPVWKELLERGGNNAVILTGAARSSGGWLERGAGSQIVEVDGSGDYDTAIKLWGDIASRLPATSRYQPEWWESRLGLVYAQYRKGRIHASDLDAARTTLGSITAVFPDYDGASEAAAADPAGPPYFPFFKYLESKLPAR